MYSIFIWHVRQYGYRAELCVQACLQSPIVTWPAGLSLGEYCALVFAGVLSFEDGLKVVKARGESMAAAATVGERITPLKLVRPYCLSGLTACQALQLVRACCVSGLVACQGLLCIRACCLSGLGVYQGLLLVRACCVSQAYCRLWACLLTHTVCRSKLQIVIPVHCLAFI